MALKINLNTPKVKLPTLLEPYLYWEDKEQTKLCIGHDNFDTFTDMHLSVTVEYINQDSGLTEKLILNTYDNFLSIDTTNMSKETTKVTITIKGIFSKITKELTKSVYLNNTIAIMSIYCSDTTYCSEDLLCN